MGRNIEIKAKAVDFMRQSELAADLVTDNVEHLSQEDTFFKVPSGRLKLRLYKDGSGELIQYDRADSLEPVESRYRRITIDDPESLKEALSSALGIRAIVRKRRTVYISGQTRIHLDDVENLGKFIELEVVLDTNDSIDYGTTIAEELMGRLQIDKQDLVKTAYVDLLEEQIK